VPAAAHRRYGHPVAEPQAGYAAAATHDLAGELMAEHETFTDPECRGILGHVQVGPADAARRDPQQHLVVSRLGDVEAADA
jgi:hypothetical protein